MSVAVRNKSLFSGQEILGKPFDKEVRSEAEISSYGYGLERASRNLSLSIPNKIHVLLQCLFLVN